MIYCKIIQILIQKLLLFTHQESTRSGVFIRCSFFSVHSTYNVLRTNDFWMEKFEQLCLVQFYFTARMTMVFFVNLAPVVLKDGT